MLNEADMLRECMIVDWLDVLLQITAIISVVTPYWSSPSPRCYRNGHPQYRGITANFTFVTADFPRLPRYYRCPHYRAALYFRCAHISKFLVSWFLHPAVNQPQTEKHACELRCWRTISGASWGYDAWPTITGNLYLVQHCTVHAGTGESDCGSRYKCCCVDGHWSSLTVAVSQPATQKASELA